MLSTKGNGFVENLMEEESFTTKMEPILKESLMKEWEIVRKDCLYMLTGHTT